MNSSRYDRLDPAIIVQIHARRACAESYQDGEDRSTRAFKHKQTC